MTPFDSARARALREAAQVTKRHWTAMRPRDGSSDLVMSNAVTQDPSELWTWRSERPTLEALDRWIEGGDNPEESSRAGARILSIENQRLRSVLGHCPKAIAVLDHRGRLTGYNRELRSLLGTDPELGAPIDSYFERADAEMLREVIAASASGKRTSAVVQLGGEQSDRHVELFVGALPIPNEDAFGVILAGEDRTHDLLDEAELRGAIDATHARAFGMAGAALREIFAGAHEQAITTLHALLDDEKREVTLGDPEVREKLCAVLTAIENASSRFGTPTPIAKRGVAEVRECAHRAARLVRPRIGLHRVYVDTRVPAGLFAGIESASLVHVLVTVVARAMRAIETASRPGHIEIFAETSPNTAVRLHVRDDGLGMAPSDVQTAFDLVPRCSDDRELALALAKRALDDAGGTMRLLSDVDRGTEVILELPPIPS